MPGEERAGVQQACQLQELLTESELSVGSESVRVPRFARWDFHTHEHTPFFFFFFQASILTRAREADYQYLAVKDLKIGDKKRDKYMLCLPYVAHKGLEQSWEWTPHEIKHPLMLKDNLVVTVLNKSTDIQTQREYKTSYSLIFV